MSLFVRAALVALAALVVVPAASGQRPPRLILQGASGSQWAAQESYCVSQATPEGGVSACGDTVDRRPLRFLAVAPRERVTVRVRASTLMLDHPDCQPDCSGSIAVYRLVGRQKRFVRSLRWRQNPQAFLAPRRRGRYEIEVGTGFRAFDGRTGDTSGSFGLRVVPTSR